MATVSGLSSCLMEKLDGFGLGGGAGHFWCWQLGVWLLLYTLLLIYCTNCKLMLPIP